MSPGRNAKSSQRALSSTRERYRVATRLEALVAEHHHPLVLRAGAEDVVALADLAQRRRRLGGIQVAGVEHGVVGDLRSFCVRLSYSASGSPPGRSVRPQPSRNSVSPDTSMPSTPGSVCPVDVEALRARCVTRRVHERDPQVADLEHVTRRVHDEIRVRTARDALHAERFWCLDVHLGRDVVAPSSAAMPSMEKPIMSPPTWSGW